MKVPFLWLKEIVDIKVTPEELARKLTLSGLEIEGIEKSSDGQAVLEINILPNRGDCQSILGIAREVAAVLNSKIKINKLKLKESNKKFSTVINVEIKEPKLCPRYMARVIENVSVKESPEWLKNKLVSAGLRPINNIVDVTNYLLLELGQPMHAFDAKKIQGGKIIVRRALEKEKIKTLDGVERTLDKEMLVIADSNRAIALAGVMGGANTEVANDTACIVLESAFFDPINTSKTQKALKMRTEASLRFEKRVDWEMVSYAMDQAAAMIAQLSGGSVRSSKIDKKSKAPLLKALELRQDKMDRILGVKIPIKTASIILKKLGFSIIKQGKASIKVKIPTWRIADIEREIDLIEEVARIYGYDKIPTSVPSVRQTELQLNKTSEISNIKDILIGLGLYEVQTFSIVDPKDVDTKHIRIMNPMVIEESVMRTSMLPSMIKVVSHNLRHQIEKIKIFEVGKVFFGHGEERGVISGAICFDKADFYDIKGIVDGLVRQFTSDVRIEGINNNWYHPAKSACYVLSDGVKPMAKFGLIHPEKAKKYDLSKEVYVFEIDIDTLLGSKIKKGFRQLPKYPKVERDIAMFLPDGIKHSDIVGIIRTEAGDIFESVNLFDVYKNSRAYRISFRDKHATLTDEIVNERFAKIASALESTLKVQIRKS